MIGSLMVGQLTARSQQDRCPFVDIRAVFYPFGIRKHNCFVRFFLFLLSFFASLGDPHQLSEKWLRNEMQTIVCPFKF